MEVNHNKISYNNLLLELIKNNESIDLTPYKEELELNIYMTLLSLSNYQIPYEYLEKTNNKIENFLRKTNNLKVKIQLKRKETEIDNLLNEIIEIYQKNYYIISKYNNQNLSIETIIKSKNAKEITDLIDNLTKNKMNKEDLLAKYHNIIERLYKMIPLSNYYLENDTIYFEHKYQEEKIQLPINDFKIFFDYLLDIDSYKPLFTKSTINKYHLETISEIIKTILVKDITKEKLDKAIIPMTLVTLNQNEISNTENINTSNFNIENIKITELYSLAAQLQNNPQTQTNTAKWKNVSIPNTYLFEKINQIIGKGTFYFKDNLFILENIDKTTNDFKLNIEISKIYDFLKETLYNLDEKKQTKAR